MDFPELLRQQIHKGEKLRLLLVRLDNVGDLLMTAPAIASIKKNLPKAEITLLTAPANSEAVSMMTGIDKVMLYEAPWTYRGLTTAYSDIGRIIREIKKRQFQGAILFSVYSQTPLPAALLCFQAGVPLRTGYSRENPYSLLSHWLPDPEPERLIRHEVVRQLSLIKELGFRVTTEEMELKVSQNALLAAINKMRQQGLNTDQPYVIIHPGASEVSRRYPWRRFAELTTLIKQFTDLQIVFTGSNLEGKIINSIQEAAGVEAFNLTDQLTFSEMVSVIDNAKLLVTNNTGPAHIASAVKTPVVVLYAKTNFQHLPWRVPQSILYFDTVCKKCLRNTCSVQSHPPLEIPSADKVFEAVLQMLKETDYRVIKRSIDDDRYSYPYLQSSH